MIWVYLGLLTVCIGVAVYTASYGRWEWKHGNRSGAAAVWLLALSAAVLPAILPLMRIMG